MIPVDLAKTPEASRLKRAYHLAEARYWRQQGNRSMKKHALHLARCEKVNKRDFLDGVIPF